MQRRNGWELEDDPKGSLVNYSDYLLLQAALREALENWKWFVSIYDELSLKRIAELRKFLDDK